MKEQRLAIYIRTVNDPDGKRSVLLQLPPDTSWITMGSSDARRGRADGANPFPNFGAAGTI